MVVFVIGGGLVVVVVVIVVTARRRRRRRCGGGSSCCRSRPCLVIAAAGRGGGGGGGGIVKVDKNIVNVVVDVVGGSKHGTKYSPNLSYVISSVVDLTTRTSNGRIISRCFFTVVEAPSFVEASSGQASRWQR